MTLLLVTVSLSPGRMGSCQRLELLVVVDHPVSQREKLLIEVPEHLCAQRAELGPLVFELTHDCRAKLGDALQEDNPILAQEPSHLIDQGGAGLDESLPHPMQGLEILLLHRHRGHRASATSQTL